MEIRKGLVAGLVAGIVMGIALFVVGAIASRIIYGPGFVPPGKFEPEQINARYFLWTKLAIGVSLGVFFGLIYAGLSPLMRRQGALSGFYYGFWLWLIITMWDISHPLVYGSMNVQHQIFWLIYSLGGFLAYGATLGYVYKRLGGVRKTKI